MSHYLATTFCGRSLFLFLTQTLILPSLTHTWSLLSAFYLGHLRTPCFTRPTRLAKSSSMANFTKASLKRNPKWKTLETELESGKLTLASSIARWWTWDRNNWNSRQLCTCVHILLDQSDTSFHMASRCLVLLCDVLCLPVVSIRASIVICFIPWVPPRVRSVASAWWPSASRGSAGGSKQMSWGCPMGKPWQYIFESK